MIHIPLHYHPTFQVPFVFALPKSFCLHLVMYVSFSRQRQVLFNDRSTLLDIHYLYCLSVRVMGNPKVFGMSEETRATRGNPCKYREQCILCTDDCKVLNPEPPCCEVTVLLQCYCTAIPPMFVTERSSG